MRPLFIVLFFLHLSFNSYSQKIDSLRISADSISVRLKQSQKKLQDLQDSMYRQNLRRSMDQNGKTLERFMADMKRQKDKEKQQLYIRIGAGVVFFAVLIFSLVRRRKKARSENKQ